jgi:hypothetical protein
MCLYLNPSGEPVQRAKIPGLSHLAWSVACSFWSAIDHYSKVRFCDHDCSDDPTSISLPPEENRHIKNKGELPSELPLHYIHGDNRDRRQAEKSKAEYFPISCEWPISTVGYCRPILTFLCQLLQHACQVTVLLFFGPLLDPGNTRALINWYIKKLTCTKVYQRHYAVFAVGKIMTINIAYLL